MYMVTCDVYLYSTRRFVLLESRLNPVLTHNVFLSPLVMDDFLVHLL